MQKSRDALTRERNFVTNAGIFQKDDEK